MDNSSQVISAPLAVAMSDDSCFYCGLPFEAISLPADDPLYKRFFKYAIKTTLRFYTPRKLDEEYEPPVIMAHSWCNCQARPLSYNDRLAFKEKLTRHTQEQQCPPWQGPNAIATKKVSKLAIKKQLKRELSLSVDQCFYCSMPFNIVPVKQGGPLHSYLNKWAKKVLEVRYIDGEKTAVLAHHWCRSTVAGVSEKERLLFKTVTAAHCTGRETMPWIDRQLLEQFEKSGGNTLDLIKRLDEALMKAGR